MSVRPMGRFFRIRTPRVGWLFQGNAAFHDRANAAPVAPARSGAGAMIVIIAA